MRIALTESTRKTSFWKPVFPARRLATWYVQKTFLHQKSSFFSWFSELFFWMVASRLATDFRWSFESSRGATRRANFRALRRLLANKSRICEKSSKWPVARRLATGHPKNVENVEKIWFFVFFRWFFLSSRVASRREKSCLFLVARRLATKPSIFWFRLCNFLSS